MSNGNLEGIGGWLILVAIGIVLTPIRLAFLLLTTYPQIFSSGMWEALTSPESESYHSLWKPIILGEIFINSAMLLLFLGIAFLFFAKKQSFPWWYIGALAFNLVYIVIDAWAVKLVLPDEPMFDPDTSRQFMSALIACLIWIPYMLVSERVKATFVE